MLLISVLRLPWLQLFGPSLTPEFHQTRKHFSRGNFCSRNVFPSLPREQFTMLEKHAKMTQAMPSEAVLLDSIWHRLGAASLF